MGDIRSCLAGVQTLHQHELSQCNLMNFEAINVGKVGSISLVFVVNVELLLDAHLSIVIVLAGVEEMLILLDF